MAAESCVVVPEWDGSAVLECWTTPVVESHGAAVPVSKPGLPSSCLAVQPPLELTVQENEALPVALVVSVAVTVTLVV